MTRQEALAAGLKIYFTGRPCPKGHIAMRRVSGACCECARLLRIAYAQANPERTREWKAADQKRNRATANARNRRWYAANQDQAKAATSRWAKENPGKNNAKAARRRAAELRAMPVWADKEKIQKVYDLAARFRSLGCDFHVDHVIPLQSKTVCGLHVHNNLEIIEARANRSKSNQLHH